MAVPEYSYVTVYFPSQISSVSSGDSTVTESGNQLSVERNDGENAGVITCMIENGYKISNAVWAGADAYNNLSVTFENNVITLHDDGQDSKSGSLTITVEQSNPKSVSNSNLARFKDKCDETYAPMSRALPAPAGTTDTGKVPTVNSAGNGYELQMPSGGGKQLYVHYITMTSDALSFGGIGVNIRCCIINDSSTAFSYDIMYYFRDTANVPITGYIGISNVYYTAVRYYADDREREFIDYLTSNGIQTQTVTAQLSVSDDVVAL